MGLMINTNVASLRAQNALRLSSNKLQQAMTRLSTGLRINSGSDDVVGLAKSESLRMRIKGVNQARANITSASSVLGVAEGYLSQMTELAQQMREMAVQAADATLSAADRSSLTTRFSSLIDEYDRLAVNANFNGVNLLDGTFTSKAIQVGSDEGDTITVSVSDARSSAIGQIAVMTTALVSTTTTSTTLTAMAFSDPAALTVAGTAIATSVFSTDGVSYTDADESAIAYVNAINSYSGTTGVTAQVLANVITAAYSGGISSLASTMVLVINGVTIKESGSSAYDTTDDDDVAALVVLINAKSAQTGVAASQNSGTDVLTLTAADGRNISMTVSGSDSTVSVNAFGFLGDTINRGITYRGTYKLAGTAAFAISGGTAEFGRTDATYALNDTTTLDNATMDTAANAGTALTVLDNVINQLQSRRASVGTSINRFQNAETELGSRLENLSSAESAIRDADIAEETARMTQANILQQAGVAVLGQANTIPQIALQLLQNL